MEKRLIVLFLFLFILVSVSGCVDINTASASELDEIKWVGPATAEKIIDARPFDSVDDLIRVSGIGEVRLQDIKDQGLACVNGDIVNEEIVVNDEPEEKEIEIVEEETEQVEQKKKTEIETISLSPKSIKTENSNLIDSDYAFYGLIIFAIFIVGLFVIRRRRYKNEFR